MTLSRGALREGVAALEAFGDLLGLRRVGPRALDRAKSDTCDACSSLVAALGPFEHTLVVALGKTSAAQTVMSALGARIRSHVSPIAEALADPAPISARRRLALEAVFRKHRAEFKDCVALCDLAVAAATAMPVDLDVVELLEQLPGVWGEGRRRRPEAPNDETGVWGEGRRRRPEAPNDETSDRIGDAPVVRVGIDVVRPVSIRADRHVLTGLLEAAVTFVNRDGPTIIRLVAGTNDEGLNVIRLSPAPRGWVLPKRTVCMPLRGEFDLAVDVARVVASRSNLAVNFDPATNSASILSSSRDASC